MNCRLCDESGGSLIYEGHDVDCKMAPRLVETQLKSVKQDEDDPTKVNVILVQTWSVPYIVIDFTIEPLDCSYEARVK